MNLPRDNLVDPPDEADFFHGIRADLDSGEIPRKFYKNILPKEWNLFFSIISNTFLVKKDGWRSLSILVQQIGVAVAHNLRINYENLIMKKMLKHLSTNLNFNVY